MMKKNILIFIAIVLFSGASFAQTRKHTVQRGETLETIANRYETSVAEITELNPDASRFIYVGMELIIPDIPAASTKSASNDKESSVSASEQKKTVDANTLSYYENYYQAQQNRAQLVNENSFSAVMFGGYFEDDIFRYGASIYMEGIVVVKHWGGDFSVGWRTRWKPFDIDYSEFGLGPVYMTKLGEDVRLYIPAKLMCQPYNDENDKIKLGWYGRINPMVRIGKFVVAGLYADIFKYNTFFGLNIGFAIPL